MEFSIDEEYAYSLAKKLGLDIEFNSDNPGVELLNGEVVSIVKVFEDAGFLNEKDD